MDKFFKIKERGSSVKTEIIAGLTTFFAMAYIVVVNPNQIVGFSFDVPGVGQIWNAVYIASIIAAVIGTMLYALYANLPFAQACGMGLNSFFFTSFILPQIVAGGDVVKGYQAGLVIILISGIIFLVLSLTGARSYIAKAMPDCLKKAIPAGIGLFIAFIGFQNVGIIQANQYTLVQFVKINGVSWKELAAPIVALVGFLIIAVLAKLNVKGSVLIGILATTVIYYLATWQLPSFDMGAIGQSFKDFANIGLAAAFKPSAWADVFDGVTIGSIFSVIMLIVVFCLVDMFDTIGTLYGAASEADMLDENGDPQNIDKAMACDAIATCAGGVCGTSTVTTFVECSAGVAAGGRTGLASLVTSICFVICLFLSPFASVIPAAATAPALIYVGVLMLKNFAKVDMSDIKNAVPAFLVLIMMPLTYSIANGIGIGAIAYTLIALFSGKYNKKDIAVTVIAILFVCKFIFGTI
ncbi:MAG: NCS2 family permease [Acutalibacteraceae bacterium]|nr:NCS2 family permease [Acutalibacteraceae bacterium]